MLYQIRLPNTINWAVINQATYDIHLVISREEQSSFVQLLFTAAIKTNKVLNNIGDAFFAEYLLPQVGRLVPMWINRVTFAKVEAFVERQEKVFLPASLVVI